MAITVFANVQSDADELCLYFRLKKFKYRLTSLSKAEYIAGGRRFGIKVRMVKICM